MLAPVISPHCCCCYSRKCPIGHAFRPNYRQGVHTGGDDLRLIEQADKYRRSVKICGSSQISRYTVGGDIGNEAERGRERFKRVSRTLQSKKEEKWAREMGIKGEKA